MKVPTILQAAIFLVTTTQASLLLCGSPYPLTYNITTQILSGQDPDLSIYSTSSLTPATGVSTAFGNAGGPIPWPRDSQNLITIPYCYARDYDKADVQAIFESSISKWETALGGKASKDAGHGIVFKEVKDSNGNSIYCKKRDEHDQWDPRVGFDTVAIVSTRGSGWYATLGLTRYEPSAAWQMQLGVSNGVDEKSCMHEVRNCYLPSSCRGKAD
jgi:hypothetical protein